MWPQDVITGGIGRSGGVNSLKPLVALVHHVPVSGQGTIPVVTHGSCRHSTRALEVPLDPFHHQVPGLLHVPGFGVQSPVGLCGAHATLWGQLCLSVSTRRTPAHLVLCNNQVSWRAPTSKVKLVCTWPPEAESVNQTEPASVCHVAFP